MNKKSMLISDIEKAPTKFKQTHKVSVSGPFDEEQPPKWFLTYMQQFKQELKQEIKQELKQELDVQEPPTWFLNYMKNFKKEINDRIENLVKLNNLKE